MNAILKNSSLYKRFRRLAGKSGPYHLYLNMKRFFALQLFRFMVRHGDVRMLVVSGLRRAGNHYLISTIINSTNRSVFFYNNINKSKRPEEMAPAEIHLKSRRHLLIIIGLEDLFVKDTFHKSEEAIRAFGLDKDHCDVLFILRDFKNLMASRLNHFLMGPKMKNDSRVRAAVIEKWCDQVKQARQRRIAFIRFNTLGEDLAANKALLKKIDAPLVKLEKKISNYGGGSSFSNNGVVERNQRWKAFKDDTIFQEMTGRAGIEELNGLFGEER